MTRVLVITLTILGSTSPHKKRGLDIDSELNYYLEQLNLLLPNMHLQWLFNNNNDTKATVALIDVNPIGGSYQVLAQARTQEHMMENSALSAAAYRASACSVFPSSLDSIHCISFLRTES